MGVPTVISRKLGAWEDVRDRLNRVLKGWEAYFHYGSTRRSYRAVNAHVRTTVTRLVFAAPLGSRQPSKWRGDFIRYRL